MMFDMPSAPFTISLPPPMGEPNEELMNNLKVYSAARFAKTRAEVEKEINDRWSVAEKAKTTEEPKPVTLPAPAEKPAEPAREEPEKGFLDDWLANNPAPKAAESTEPESESSPAEEAPSRPSEAATEPTSEPAPAKDGAEAVFRIR
jgi:hypothetical protein